MKLMKQVPTQVPGTRDELDRVFDRFFGPGMFTAPRTLEAMWTPALDFSENDKEYIVRAEIPGIPKEDLEVNLDGQVLTIAGHRELQQGDKTEEFFWREREIGKFVRMIRLPAPVEGAKIAAQYQDGVVTIHLPKAQPTVRTRVPIG